MVPIFLEISPPCHRMVRLHFIFSLHPHAPLEIVIPLSSFLHFPKSNFNLSCIFPKNHPHSSTGPCVFLLHFFLKYDPSLYLPQIPSSFIHHLYHSFMPQIHPNFLSQRCGYSFLTVHNGAHSSRNHP